MEGEPEGSSQPQARGRLHLGAIVLVAVFAAYLAFRVIQGAIWLIGRF